MVLLVQESLSLEWSKKLTDVVLLRAKDLGAGGLGEEGERPRRTGLISSSPEDLLYHQTQIFGVFAVTGGPRGKMITPFVGD